MDFDLKPEHVQIRDTVRKFCVNEVIPFAEKWEKDEVFPRETIRNMGERNSASSPTALWPKNWEGPLWGWRVV